MTKPIYLLLLLPSILLGQSTDQNYTASTTYKVATLDGETKAGTNGTPLEVSDSTYSISYYDGLGKPIQSVAVGQGGTGEDMIQTMRYDSYGRQVYDYLPYTAPSLQGDIHLNHHGEQPWAEQTLYHLQKYGDQHAYSQKVVENSPLSRVLEQAAPGSDWQLNNGHTIKK